MRAKILTQRDLQLVLLQVLIAALLLISIATGLLQDESRHVLFQASCGVFQASRGDKFNSCVGKINQFTFALSSEPSVTRHDFNRGIPR